MASSTGRRRRTRSEARTETRAAILAAARQLFTERGYRGASLDEIADVAGFSKGAVYSNWTSKEALFLELLDAARTEQPTDEMSTRPTGWALATLDFFVEAVRSPETRRVLADRYREARGSLAPGLSEGLPDPSWATWEELATAAMALGSGLVIQAAIDETAVDPSLAGRVMDRLLEAARRQDPPRAPARRRA
jgi:AcrR family transcriptional regulator